MNIRQNSQCQRLRWNHSLQILEKFGCSLDQNEHDHFHLYSNIVFIIFKYLKQVWYCLNLRHMKCIEFMYYHKAVREEKESVVYVSVLPLLY